MVSTAPNEDIDPHHLARVEQMRQEDNQTPDPEASRTLSGQEVVEQESRKLSILLTQFRGHPDSDHRTYEQLRAEVEALQGQAEQATEHNAQFVLAENMREVSLRIQYRLAA